jgi:hypothetical protein
MNKGAPVDLFLPGSSFLSVLRLILITQITLLINLEKTDGNVFHGPHESWVFLLVAAPPIAVPVNLLLSDCGCPSYQVFSLKDPVK